MSLVPRNLAAAEGVAREKDTFLNEQLCVIHTESFREASPDKASALSICDKADGDRH